MGPKASTSPVFAAENTPAIIRGGLVMSWQLWVGYVGLSLHVLINLLFRLPLESSSGFVPTWLYKVQEASHGALS